MLDQAEGMSAMNQDEEHLKLLRIFYVVYGLFHFVMACMPLIHVLFGTAIVTDGFGHASSSSGNPPPVFMGWIFIAVGVFAMFMIASIGACNLIVASSLKSYRKYVFILIIAGINCMSFPLGTALGVFTIIVLTRPSVKELFTGPGPLNTPYRG